MFLAILAGSLIANGFLYNQQLNSNSQNAHLQEQSNELSSNISSLENENDNLQSQLTELNQNGPKLATRIGATPIQEYKSPATGLYVGGEVWNVGTSDAQDCKLDVTFYVGTKIVNDTYIDLGSIKIGGYVDVKSYIYYSHGITATNWTITPEYSQSPAVK